MRKTTSFGIAALLVAVIAGAWMMSHAKTIQTVGQSSSNASLLDPLDMMRKVKDLPVHHILDAI